jgi:hypothetical protein
MKINFTPKQLKIAIDAIAYQLDHDDNIEFGHIDRNELLENLREEYRQAYLKLPNEAKAHIPDVDTPGLHDPSSLIGDVLEAGAELLDPD